MLFQPIPTHLSVNITRNPTGEITDHLVMSKKKTIDPKYKQGMTFTQTKKPPNAINYLFINEKEYKKSSLGSKFDNKPQSAISGSQRTVTKDKIKIVHRTLISIFLLF